MWCLSWSPVQSWYVASTRKSRLLPRMKPADLSACDFQEIVWPSFRFCKLNLNGDLCRMFACQKGRHKEGWTITTVTGRCATLSRRHLFFQRSLFPWQGTGCIDAATSTPPYSQVQKQKHRPYVSLVPPRFILPLRTTTVISCSNFPNVASSRCLSDGHEPERCRWIIRKEGLPGPSDDLRFSFLPF